MPKAQAQPQAPAGVVLSVPPGITDVSWNGQQYEIIGGLIEVPEEAVPDLLAFGFALDGGSK